MHDTNHQSRITNHAGYEIRENEMLENKTTTIGTASAAIAGLALSASLLLAPSAALADNECGPIGVDPSANGATADSYDCDAASYGSGVTYTADGNLTIDFSNDATSTIGGTGITLMGDGGEDITFDSNDPTTTIRSLSGMDGDLLGVTTVDGNILITTSTMDGDTNSAAGVDRAIFAQSTGTGGIDITTAGFVDAFSGTNPDTSVGIEAITNTGDIDLTVASGSVNGNLYAIRTETGAAARATVNNSGTIDSDTALRATGGALTFNNDGTIRGRLDFTGLSGGYTFNNDGTWRVGTFNSDTISPLGAGDLNNAGMIDVRRRTVISAPGTNFTGIGDSVLEIDVVLANGISNLDCATPTDVAGCMDLTGGSTSGQTSILIQANAGGDPFHDPIDAPVNAGIILIDVGGGSSAAEHFVLDPDSGAFSESFYAMDPKYGAIIDAPGMFDYTLLYDPQNQQHVLTSVPQKEGVEYVSFIHEALSIWHTTSDAVVGRQADLRHGGQRGGWIRIVSEQTERDSTATMTTHGNTFTYDNDYKLNTKSLIVGYDLTASDNHVVGLHLGLVAARQEYDSSSSRDETRGAAFGAYAGWWNEAGLTLDATLNANTLEVDHSLDRDLEDSSTKVKSLGLRAEAGWRLPLAGEAFYVQPLATAAYVLSDISALDLRDYDLRFKGDKSARAALGARLGGERELSGDRYSRLKYWLTARAWDEQEDGANVQYQTDGDPLVIEDDLSGSFEEVGLGASLTNAEGDISVFFSGNLRSGDDTDGSNVTIGARMNW